MWGRGPRGSNGACCTLCRISVTPFAIHNQIGPFWCCCLSGCVCVRCRPLWAPPRNSPVRLGVSPAAASTPTGIFNQKFEALFPCTGALGCLDVNWSTSFCLAGQLQLSCRPAAALPAPLYNPPPHWVHQPPSPLCPAACLRRSYWSG